MNNSHNKIDLLLTELKVSRSEFLEKVGVSYNTYANWRKRDLGINVINKIVNAYPQVSYEWLISGKGNVLAEPEPNSTSDVPIDKTPDIPRVVGNNKELNNAVDLFTDQALRMEKFIVMLSNEISEVRSIKEDLLKQKEETKMLQKELRDAIFALRSVATYPQNFPLMAADQG